MRTTKLSLLNVSLSYVKENKCVFKKRNWKYINFSSKRSFFSFQYLFLPLKGKKIVKTTKSNNKQISRLD